MDKIKITRIADEARQHKGFDHRGCHGHNCDDACCFEGCTVDKESYDLIFSHRQEIEKAIGRKLEDCFRKEWLNESDFLGGNGIWCKTINNTCVFHMNGTKGCALWLLVINNKAPKRIIPSICRLYPLTWENGELRMHETLHDSCNVKCHRNSGARKIMETQKDAIEDIFEISQSLIRK